MPTDGRISRLSNSSRATAEVMSILQKNAPERGKLKFEPTPSKKSIKIDPDHVVFKTSSLALLNAKGKNRGHLHDMENLSQEYESKEHGMIPDELFSNDIPSNEEHYTIYTQDDAEHYLSGARRVLQFMYALWRQQRMCDVVLHTSSMDILAHRVTLGAYSDTLVTKFSEFPAGEIISIDVNDINTETVKTILTFVYTTEITISDSNVEDLLYCSTELGMEYVMALCVDHLTNELHTQNALTFYMIAENQNLDELKGRIMKFVIENFSAITGSRQFLHFSLESLVSLLSNDGLGVNSELEIFHAIVRWIDIDRPNRMTVAPMMLRCVRFQHISIEMLISRVESVSWMFVPRECHEWLYQAIRFHALKGCSDPVLSSYTPQQSRGYFSKMNMSLQSHPEQFVPTILPKDTSPILTKLEAVNQSSLFHGQIQYPSDRRLPSMMYTSTPIKAESPTVHHTIPPPEVSQMPSMPVSSNLLQIPAAIAVGGLDLQSIDPDVPGKFLYCYAARTNNWATLAAMERYTHHHGVVTLNRKLYVVGGAVYDQATPGRLGHATNAVQEFDLINKSWSSKRTASMRDHRSYHAVATWSGKIFAVGGEDEHKTKLDTIECYNPQSDSWSYVARMVGGPKIGMAVAVFENCLYIVGGYNKDRSGNQILADVECFDLVHERWVKKRPLQTVRCHANLIVSNNKLFLIGGRTKTNVPERLNSLSAVEVYHPSQDTWEHVADLKHARHDAGCFSLGSNVYIAGGVQSPSPLCLSSVECFNSETYHTIEGVASMLSPAAGVACTPTM